MSKDWNQSNPILPDVPSILLGDAYHATSLSGLSRVPDHDHYHYYYCVYFSNSYPRDQSKIHARHHQSHHVDHYQDQHQHSNRQQDLSAKCA